MRSPVLALGKHRTSHTRSDNEAIALLNDEAIASPNHEGHEVEWWGVGSFDMHFDTRPHG